MKTIVCNNSKIVTGIVFVWLALSINSLNAQTQTNITVLSKSDNSPLIGATITSNTSSKDVIGWSTNTDGVAKILVSAPGIYIISYLGFLSQEVLIEPGIDVSVELYEDVLGMEEVVVTGAFAPTTVTKSLYKVKKLDATTIEARGSVNLSDVLQTQLNMKTIQDDVLGTRVVLQGISGPNVKMLMDGVPLVNGSGGEFDLSQISMNNVERIEIVEGPLSVQYGTNALAGTINIITRDYRVNETFAMVNTYYESVGQYNADVALAQGWENLSISIGGSRNQFDGFSSTGERKENWTPRTQYLANAKVKTTLKDLSLTGSYNQMWENSISHGNGSSAFNSRTNRLSEIASDNYNETVRINGALTLDGKLSQNQYVNLVNGVSKFEQGSQRFLQDVIADIKWLSSDPADHDTTSFTTWTFRGTYVHGNTSVNEGIYITGGYEVNLNRASGGRINDEADGSIDDYGVFGAIEIPFGSKLKVQLAFRYTENSFYDTGDINFLGMDLPILPSINLMYKPTGRIDARFSYGKGYRSPSVRELYYEFIDANHYIVGSTSLLPEVGNNFNASLTWRPMFGSVATIFTPSIFFSQIDNKIDLIQILDRETLPENVPKNVPVARVYENIPNFKSYGINLTSEIVWKSKLRISPGFGVLARSGSEAGDQFYNSYEANLNTSYTLQNNLTLNVFYKFNGRITEFAREEDGSIGVLTLEEYHTIDLSASKPLLEGKLLATLGAKNLFDVTDISLVGEGSKGLVLQTGREDFYPISWGRTLFIKISYSL